MHTHAPSVERAIDAWLDLKSARSASTRRNYAAAINRWLAFLAGTYPDVSLWNADPHHVRDWQQALRTQGLAESSINHKLSCVSSFYAYVQEHRLGASTGAFNPFRSDDIHRTRGQTYARAQAMNREEVAQLLTWLEKRAGSVAGARNYALILTFLCTGWRSSELLRMRWGDLRRSRTQAGLMLFAWQGRGNRRTDDVLPAACFQAICRYLRADGRLGAHAEPAASEPIWLPVCAPHMDQLRHAPTPDNRRPLSERSALRIVKSALRGAGIRNWDCYRIHDLRHTHAHLLLESGQSLEVLQQRLHHASLATTRLYVKAVHGDEPRDVVTEAFAGLLKQQTAGVGKAR